MGTSPDVVGPAPIHVFYSSRSWIEGRAVDQLGQVARQPGVTAIAAMPDLHPGKYGPVGCAVLASTIRPELAGSDIGCGMALLALDIPVRKLRLDRIAERLRGLDAPWEGDPATRLDAAGLAPHPLDAALGTIGGGNHFCEVQAIEEVLDAGAARRLGLDADLAYLLVHSGSRGIGADILRRQSSAGLVPLAPDGEAGVGYLTEHDRAVRWAIASRRLIAERAAAALRCDLRPLADVPHNLVEATPAGILHRKGAAASDRGVVPVPGSRGTLSYLVEPTAPDRPEALASLAHGAGRKYDRSSMHGRVRTKRSDLDRLARNPFGGHVVCEDRDLLVEEAPEAYKSIAAVIDDLAHFGLARPIASFRPLVTFKKALGARVEERDRRRGARHGEENR